MIIGHSKTNDCYSLEPWLNKYYIGYDSLLNILEWDSHSLWSAMSRSLYRAWVYATTHYVCTPCLVKTFHWVDTLDYDTWILASYNTQLVCQWWSCMGYSRIVTIVTKYYFISTTDIWPSWWLRLIRKLHCEAMTRYFHNFGEFFCWKRDALKCTVNYISNSCRRVN